MIKYLKKLIKNNKFLMLFIENFMQKNKIIKNYYKKNFSKHILISYINAPFLNKKLTTHSNQQEALIIARIFDELEFNVDIINFQCNRNLNLKKYDIIFGFGDIFEKSFYDGNFKGKRIFYATGAEQDFQVNSEIRRVKEFNKRHKSNLLPKRLPPSYWPLSYSFSDVIILIGNDWTKKTWEKIYDGIILKQVGSNIFFEDFDKYKTKDKEFVFIGSSGAIHKGLDLCIETFRELPSNFILNIFAHYEEDFLSVYKELPENIKFHGFKDINSKEFKKILGKCSFILAPTCSEGQMTSLILGIGNGLLPLATKESGVDLPEEFILKNLESSYLKNTILEIYNLNDEEYEKNIFKLQEKIKKEHSLEAFEKCFRKNIMTINNKIF